MICWKQTGSDPNTNKFSAFAMSSVLTVVLLEASTLATKNTRKGLWVHNSKMNSF